MKLTTEDGTQIENPSGSDISRAIGSLSHDGNGFAILAADDEIYPQAAGSILGGFILEYREGSWEKHFQTSQPTSTNQVIEAMQQYAVGDDSWRTSFSWEIHESQTKGGCAAVVFIALVLPIIGAIHVVWQHAL